MHGTEQHILYEVYNTGMSVNHMSVAVADSHFVISQSLSWVDLAW